MPRKKQKAEDENRTGSRESYDEPSAWLTERTCPECGKAFTVVSREIWVYKAGQLLLCSWHCVRAREKRLAGNTVKRVLSSSGRVRLNHSQVEKMTEMYEAGESLSEIGRTFGVRAETVRYHVVKDRRKE